MRFVRRFENIASYERVNAADQLHYFARCMKEQAQTWYETQDFVSISEAKESFLIYYWSDEAQARLCEKLYTGRYVSDGSNKLSMSEYAQSLVRQAKLLEPPMSDHEIIRCLKRHFSADVARKIRPGTVTNISDLSRILDDIKEEQRLIRESKIRKAREDKENALRGARRNVRREEDRRDGFFDARQNFGRSNFVRPDFRPNVAQYRSNFSPNNVRPVYKNEQQRERDAKNVNQNPQGQDNKNRASKLAAFDANNESDFEDEYDGNNAEITSVRDKAHVEQIKAIEYNVEQTDQIAGLGLIRTREILRDVDETCGEAHRKQIRTDPTIEIGIGDSKVKALVDTGAQISAMTKELYDELRLSSVKCP